jgi:GntR family transcriptional regulator
MSINRHSHRPLYRQLADDLRDQIRTGQYQPNGPLPSETDLAYTYQVGMPTVRRALAVLRGEALIDAERGRRAWVRPATPRRTVVLRGCDQVVVRTPSDPQRHQLGLREAVAIIELDHGDGAPELLPADEVALVVAHR